MWQSAAGWSGPNPMTGCGFFASEPHFEYSTMPDCALLQQDKTGSL
ncbi:MAG TPA: hypothetical protein VM821_02895 [Abditibacteriaceae bacterium]|nr:hypothetical protein [Abditibacteriaceae bacterium]